MNCETIIRELIQRTAADFVSCFEGTPRQDDAEWVIAAAINGSPALSAERALVDAMLPEAEDDGRVEASYALNTGAMVLSLIDSINTQDEQHYRDAVTLFFDTVDFKVHEQLEAALVTLPVSC